MIKFTKDDDADMQRSLPALRRAARRALEIAKLTGTPCYVMKDGKIVNLNPKGSLRRKRRVSLFF